MENIWKGVMRLNAKAFCLISALLFFCVTAWCGFRFLTPQEPFKEGGRRLEESATSYTLTTLGFVSNQLSQESLTIPVDPFRPTMEAIFTNETERAAWLKAYHAQQAAAAGIKPAAATAAAAKKEDPFAALRKKEKVPGQLVGPNGEKMIIPKITFLGFIERPDGTRAAMFSDSTDHSARFYTAGGKLHGVEITSTDLHSAEVKMPDGSTRKLTIGGAVTLAPEPMKISPKVSKARKAAKAGKEKTAKQGAAKKRK